MQHNPHRERVEAAYEAASEYVSWDEFMRRVKLPPGVSFRGSVRHVAIDGYRLRFTETRPDREDGRPTTIVISGTVDGPPNDPRRAMDAVRDILLHGVAHELDEQLQLCNVRVFDPHERNSGAQ